MCILIREEDLVILFKDPHPQDPVSYTYKNTEDYTQQRFSERENSKYSQI